MATGPNRCVRHLRISATRWSVPTGLYPTHWEGRYFGFDEYFSFMALVRSGHFDVAGRIPRFRRDTLEAARGRSARHSKWDDGSARYAWESCEDGREGGPDGFWFDHIFHMASIALECSEYHVFTGDSDYLRRVGYPVMRACAQFFLSAALGYDHRGRRIVTRCTDLERLGPYRENPFLTACGVIAAFEAVVRAADILRTDPELARACRGEAEALRVNLPVDGGKYIPFEGCPEPSIAVLGGVFPYPAVSPRSPEFQNAYRDFEARGGGSGNMYHAGKGVCSWYASWFAVTRARMGDGDATVRWLRSAAADAGCFRQMFEIRESGLRPWFTTAAAVYVQAVLEMLVQVDASGARVCPAIPSDWRDFSFTLPSGGGGRVELAVRNGTPAHFVHTPGGAGAPPVTADVRFPLLGKMEPSHESAFHAG